MNKKIAAVITLAFLIGAVTGFYIEKAFEHPLVESIKVYDIPIPAGTRLYDVEYNPKNGMLYITNFGEKGVTSGYIIELDPETGNYSIQSLPAGAIYNIEMITIDTDGNVWVSNTYKNGAGNPGGVIKFDISIKTVTLFTISNAHLRFAGLGAWGDNIVGVDDDRVVVWDKAGTYVKHIAYPTGFDHGESCSIKENHGYITGFTRNDMCIINLDTGDKWRYATPSGVFLTSEKLTRWDLKEGRSVIVCSISNTAASRYETVGGIWIDADQHTVLGFSVLGAMAPYKSSLPTGYFFASSGKTVNLVNYQTMQSVQIPMDSVASSSFDDKGERLFAVSSSGRVVVIQLKSLSMAPYKPLIISSLNIFKKTSVGVGTTTLDDCTPLVLAKGETLTLTVECTYHASATAGIKVYVYSSHDGKNYDTDPYVTITPPFSAGETVRKTQVINPGIRFLTLKVENLDGTHAASNVKVVATVKL